MHFCCCATSINLRCEQLARSGPIDNILCIAMQAPIRLIIRQTRAAHAYVLLSSTCVRVCRRNLSRACLPLLHVHAHRSPFGKHACLRCMSAFAFASRPSTFASLNSTCISIPVWQTYVSPIFCSHLCSFRFALSTAHCRSYARFCEGSNLCAFQFAFSTAENICRSAEEESSRIESAFHIGSAGGLRSSRIANQNKRCSATRRRRRRRSRRWRLPKPRSSSALRTSALRTFTTTRCFPRSGA